jgi:phospholipid transport system substrate-binding protein
MKNIVLSCVLLLLIASPVLALPSPQAQVKQMVDSVLEVLQDAELSVDEKKNLISGRVQRFLNIDSMARRTLGQHWDDATIEQRQRFADLFIQVLEGTYLNRVESYSDGSVRYQMQRVKGDKAIIDTVILAGDVEIPVQYKMIYEDNRWQVFDLVIEGISLIRNYRSSYGEIIRREGYEGLFALMQEKIDARQGGGAAGQ